MRPPTIEPTRRRRRTVAAGMAALLAGAHLAATAPLASATQTEEWSGNVSDTVSSTSGGDVTTVEASVDGATWIQAGLNGELTDPPDGGNPYSPASMAGAAAWSFQVPAEEDAGRITFTFSNPVVNPILGIDRLGGNVSGTSNSSEWTLVGDGWLERLSGVDHFEVTEGVGGSFVRPVGVDLEAPTGLCRFDGDTGTACGSVQVLGTFTEIAFDVAMVGEPGAGDGMELAWYWEQDLGDAPESFGRAIHAIAGPAGGAADPAGPFLGALRPTDDPDGNEFSAEADRDANDDGVVFPALETGMAGETYTVPVQVGDSGAAGELCGWIDWGQDGTFDADERQCAPAPSGSTVPLTWTVPAGLDATEPLFARFRIASDGAEVNAPTGAASDGEVEDHLVDLQPTEAWSASKSVLTPVAAIDDGAEVEFQIVIANTGDADLTDLEVVDDLSGVLDDATWNDDATATSGSLAFAAPTLTWTGDLAAGETATVTYSVTVASPGRGDRELVNRISGSPNCPSGPECSTTSPLPALPGDPVVRDATETAECGTTVTFDVTSLEPGVTPGSVFLLDPDGAPVRELVVAGEGTWTVDPATGVVTFEPLPNAPCEVTPVDYVAALADGTVVTGTLTVDYEPRPAPAAPAPDPARAEVLPRTGGDVWTMVGASLAMILGGFALCHPAGLRRRWS